MKDIISKIVRDILLARKKCSHIVKNVLAQREVEKIFENLKICKYSILVDENTDITDNKVMCILVRYVSPSSKQIKTQLLELLSLDAKDCSMRKIFETFKNFLEEEKLSQLKILLEWHVIMHL